jgi:hypothetical protein
MMVQVQNVAASDRLPKAGKITCTTCKLKGCVGRCHFEKLKPKAA